MLLNKIFSGLKHHVCNPKTHEFWCHEISIDQISDEEKLFSLFEFVSKILTNGIVFTHLSHEIIHFNGY